MELKQIENMTALTNDEAANILGGDYTTKESCWSEPIKYPGGTGGYQIHYDVNVAICVKGKWTYYDYYSDKGWEDCYAQIKPEDWWGPHIPNPMA